MNKFPNDLILLGKIIKPYGIKGQIKFKPFNQNSSILIRNSIVWLKKENVKSLSFKFFKITSINYSSLHPIIKFEGINNRNEAIEFKDYVIYISRSLFPDSNNNDIYFFDIIGCKVYNEDKKFIGIAKDVIHFPKNNHVMIIENEYKECMIPINSNLIKFFDFDKKHIIIDIIDGLVDNE